MLLGLWMAIFLNLGFPPGWDKVIAAVVGILTIGIAYRMANPGMSEGAGNIDSGVTYVEHKPSKDERSSTEAGPIISENR